MRIAIPRRNEEAISDACELYGIERARIRWLPPVTPIDVHDFLPPATVVGKVRRRSEILFPGRLSAERLPTLASAAEFALKSGRILRVVGAGKGKSAFEEFLEESACELFEVVEDANLSSWFEEADVVVAAGLTALEALVHGCSVLIPRAAAAGGGISSLVTPASFRELHQQNFTGHSSIITVEEAWDAIELLTERDRVELARLVSAEASPEAGLQAIMEGGESSRNRSDQTPELLRSMARDAVRSRALVHELTWWCGELTDARDHYRDHAGRLEAELEVVKRLKP